MAISDLTDPKAVLRAIDEFDALGREEFLKKYGFGPSKKFFLLHEGNRYDSKAILGAAYGFQFPERGPFTFGEFSGGDQTTNQLGKKLGFTIVEAAPNELPQVGDILTNEDICAKFGVGIQGGMRRSRLRKLLVLISDPFKSIYQDRWEGTLLHYTGMGPVGHQSLTYSQNRTLTESPKTHIPIHLLEALSPQRYTYAGQVELTGSPYQEEQVDTAGAVRKVWMFPVRLLAQGRIPEPTLQEAKALVDAQAQIAKHLTLQQLKEQAKAGKKKPTRRTAQGTVYERNPAVAELVKRLANGICDLCQTPAPFINRKNEAYLECHHVVWLAKDGADDVTNTVALCPNCHRKMHILNTAKDQKHLLSRAKERNKANDLI